MRYVAGYTFRDYVDQSPRPNRTSPVVLVAWGAGHMPVESLRFRRVQDLTDKPEPGDILLIEQESGAMYLLAITRLEAGSTLPGQPDPTHE